MSSSLTTPVVASSGYRDAIEINNIAVQNLEYNNISSACKLLLPAVKSILVDYSSTTKSFCAESWKHTHFKWSRSIHGTKSKGGSNNAEPTVGSFLFSRAMYIQDLRPVRHSLSAQVVSSDIKAAIIYNAGLAHHLLAIKNNNDSTLLSKARDMYRLSQAILRDCNQKKKSSSKLLHKHFFHVAILNNMGQICYEFLDYTESRHYFQNVEANLLHIISRESRRKKHKTNPSVKKPPIFYPLDILGMMTNSLVDIPTAAPCA
mmetsp:Transcript_14170/g.20937  ORF Transcript_14170/g.20937 Transcript_14170/m.20937 type:complete len:261 (-) Transcript_14170:77-859(-)|eukprot:CAMPEP_0194199656 /NCGR_PEP_ID=MMETSP0156-20130528/596_1 /TAXON_ID=33649 /ORGANISM="Thalassionema nitzschioides, Strain L26-B" /LENGTH=260 /DNA_ID=CAMNT_0038924587 /DNA_START=89 /DNA_END=871 /DNA_ORIENTATION=-